MKGKPVVGQKLFVVSQWRRDRKGEELEVTKVGRKYFTVGDERRDCIFRLSDWSQKTDYSADVKVYLSEKEYQEEVEGEEICRKISEAFTYGNKKRLPIESLRRILEIVEKR